MPIRFRCAYCNQLMGIARRKAGTVVRCPTCSGQVVVPATDQTDLKEDPASPRAFERSDFDDVLQFDEGSAAEAPLPQQPAGSWGTHAEPRFDVERIEPYKEVERPPGLLLSPGRATILTIVVLVALAVAFGSGFLFGYLLKPVAPAEAPVDGSDPNSATPAAGMHLPG